MIVLDTNVISELMRPRPDPMVVRWVADRPTTTLRATSINTAEILYGIALCPAVGAARLFSRPGSRLQRRPRGAAVR